MQRTFESPRSSIALVLETTEDTQVSQNATCSDPQGNTHVLADTLERQFRINLHEAVDDERDKIIAAEARRLRKTRKNNQVLPSGNTYLKHTRYVRTKRKKSSQVIAKNGKENYRLIPLLSAMSEITEGVIEKRINKHMQVLANCQMNSFNSEDKLQQSTKF